MTKKLAENPNDKNKKHKKTVWLPLVNGPPYKVGGNYKEKVPTAP